MKSSGEHRRGRSMGSSGAARVVGEKDEDLALFHEMKRREKHNFLHPSPDDLDATLSSKFGGMGAPVKKPGNDLLTSESDKNDYDWLLTPPGTPLFPSLDQEAAALAVLSPALSNGSYSSASSATRSLKSSHSPADSVSKGNRGNPSPRRPSSAGSTTPNGLSRSRSSPGTAANLAAIRPSTPTSSSATRPSTPTSTATTKPSTPSLRASTPNLKLTISNSSKSYSTATTPTGTRPSTPTPRSSTPPVRPSTPGGRSSTPTSKPSTPTMRRSLSGGRSGLTSPSTTTTRGGPSPKRTTSSSRGNSPSAKRVTAVITSIAGMPSEAPPNLRTSLPERPSSTGKSNSNGSRGGPDSGHHNNSMHHNNVGDAQNRRRPRSPSITRSFSSSSSQDQRTTSSQTSRGSVISSYDDGLEVNRPSLGSTRNSSAGKWHAAGHEELLSGKANSFAKGVSTRSSVPSKEISGSGYGGTPTKKSSDPVKRPVDAYQNSPTSAYRHLHSSSPGSPFFSTRSNSLLLRPGSAMNSSVTTSSNASSEHGTTIAPDTEGSERDEDDLLSWDSYGRRASTSPRQQADILVLDKDDEKPGSWHDSLYERANSRESTPRSQSTLDAEVSSFYENDGIASLEMLEQLGLMGESYKLKKKTSPAGVRYYEKRASSSTEDSKMSNLRSDETAHSNVAHRLLHEVQGVPGRQSPRLERQESSESLRKSLERLEGSDSLRKSLERLESSDSLRRSLERLESSDSLRKSLERLEGSDILRRSLERQESLETLRRSRNLEAELLRIDTEKVLTLPEVKPPNSQVSPACLFVRDFKAGLAPPPNIQELAPQFMKESSSGSNKHGIDEMEMKLRNDLSYDWENSLDLEQTMTEAVNDTTSYNVESSKLSDSPILASHPNGYIASLEPTLPSLEDPFISSAAVYSMKNNGSSFMTSAVSKRVGSMEKREAESTLSKDVDLDHPISMNGTSTRAAIDSSFVLDGVMVESKPESLIPEDVDLDFTISLKYTRSSAMIDERVLHKKIDIHDLSLSGNHVSDVHSVPRDEVYAMDEDVPKVYAIEDAVAAEDSEVLETAEDGHFDFLDEQEPVDIYRLSFSQAENLEDYEDGGHEVMDFLEAGNQEGDEDGDLEVMELLDTQDIGVADRVSEVMEVLEGEDKDVEGDDVMEVSEAGKLPSVVDQVVEVVHVPEAQSLEEVTCEVPVHLLGKDELSIPTDSNILQVSEGENKQHPEVHSNGNYYLPDYDGVQENDASLNSNAQMVLVRGVDEEHTQEGLLEHSDRRDEVYAKEALPVSSYGDSDGIGGHEASVLKNSESAEVHDDKLIREGLDPCLRSDTIADEIRKVEEIDAEPVEITKGPVEEVRHVRSDNVLPEEESQGLVCTDPESAAVFVDIGEEFCSGLSNQLVEEVKEEPQSLKYCNINSVKMFDQVEVGPKAGIFLQNGALSVSSQASEEPSEECEFFQKEKLPEPASQSVDCEPLLNVSGESYKSGANGKPKSIFQSFENHTEVLDVAPKSEGESQIHPLKPGFRSASTLCAALEEQIAGLIQKIDHAIEESSKPFNSSQQESFLVKDKQSILSSRELEQDESGVSIRSSQEEDLLDMLWAEDDDSSSSEGSRDQDLSFGKDISQREINGVRSSRLSDRGLAGGPRSETYDALVRSSLSDLGVEILSRKSTLGLVDHHDSVVQMLTRDADGSPLSRSVDMTTLTSDVQYPVAGNVQFHPDSQPGVMEIGDDGVQLKTDEDSLIVSCDRGYDTDSLTDSSGDEGDGDEMKTANEFFAFHTVDHHEGDLKDLPKSTEDEVPSSPETEEFFHVHTSLQQQDLNSLSKSSGDEEFLDRESRPAADQVSSVAETFEEDSKVETSSIEGGPQGVGSSEDLLRSQEDASLRTISPDVLQKSISSNGDMKTVEGSDPAIKELSQKCDRVVHMNGSQMEQERDESPILLTLIKSSSTAAREIQNEEQWLHRKSNQQEDPVKIVSSLHQVAGKDRPESKPHVEDPTEEHEILQEVPDGKIHSLMSRTEDIKKQEATIDLAHDSLILYARDWQDPSDEGTQILQEEQSHLQKSSLSFTTFSSQDEEALLSDLLPGKKMEKETFASCGEVNFTSALESTRQLQNDSLSKEVPERCSVVHSDLDVGSDADAKIQEEDLFTLAQGSPQVHSGRHLDALRQGDSLPCFVAGQSVYENEAHSEEAQGALENGMPCGNPENYPVALLDESDEVAQIQKWKSNQRHADSWKGHVSVISGNKTSKADTDSLRMEESDESQAEKIGRYPCSLSSSPVPTTTGRDHGSEEAHVGSGIDSLKEQKHFKRETYVEGTATGVKEVTRLSVWSEIPVRPSVGTEEISAKSDEFFPDGNGNGDFGIRQERITGVGSQSAKRVPINKAKSVRTVSLSSVSQNESPSEENGSPERAVEVQKSNGYANITVISQENLQWDHLPIVDETVSKTRNSPGALSRSMTLAEATDTILYCSSLMHTIVYKAAAYAIEKEELAAIASTPTSNGEVPRYPGLSEVDSRDQNDSGEGEPEKLRGQVVSSGPASVRRSLSYMGHQTAPFTPADTSLQIPADQVIEKEGRAPAVHTAIQVNHNQKDEVPVKVPKSKCGCTIM